MMSKVMKWLMIGLVLVGLSACGGGGAEGGGDQNSSDDTPVVQKVIISGYVVDDPVAGASVKVLSLSSDELGSATTDSNGSYSVEVDESKIANGFIVEATGGKINGADFNATMKAIYSASDDKTQANVTPITSLVAKMAEDSIGRSGTLIERRDEALLKIEDIGLIQHNEQSKIYNPEYINSEKLLGQIKLLGLGKWIESVVNDLTDSKLSGVNLNIFYKANGGVANIMLSSFEAIEGEKAMLKIIPIVVDGNTTGNYKYIVDNVTNGTADINGSILLFTPSSDINSSEKATIRITAINKDTLKSRTETVTINISNTEVVATGVIGIEGGSIKNDWGDVVLTVPEGAVDDDSEFKIIKVEASDGVYYDYTSSKQLKKGVLLKTPKFLDTNQEGIENRDRATENGWVSWGSLYHTFLSLYQGITGSGVSYTNRVANFADQQDIFLIPGVKQKNLRAASLYSYNCGYSYDAHNECEGKDPVLLIHGFVTGTEALWGEGANAGGGESTWGKMGELLANEGYAVFEFTWKTAARFEDVADDLSTMIRLINNKTKKKVNIVAHSFGGLLSRTYIQGKAYSRDYEDNVQSLLTLSTPHSGIFDDDITKSGIAFPGGQDAFSFELCKQLSCHEAGESANVWTAVRNVAQNPLLPSSVLNYSLYFGVNPDEAGSLTVKLATDIKERGYSFPIPTKVLKSRTIDLYKNEWKRLPWSIIPELVPVYRPTYEAGDALISIEGQGFYPGSSIANVEEEEVSIISQTNNGFQGYRHSDTLFGQGSGVITSRGDRGIAYVLAGGKATGEIDHRPYRLIVDWLKNHPCDTIVADNVTIHLKVVDAEDNEVAIESARIGIGIDGQNYILPNKTDANGEIDIELPYKRNEPFEVFVSADGYKSDTFTEGFVMGSTVENTQNFPKIQLQKNLFGKGNLSGKIINAENGIGIANVLISVTNTRNNDKNVTTTDSNGDYTIEGLPRGIYTVSISKDGYLSSSYTVNVLPSQTNEGGHSLSAVLTNQQMRIRLSWDENPSDLDSHLVKYDASGNEKYHIYYSTYNTNDGSNPDNKTPEGDSLDHDDTTSYGPETITIANVDSSARYVYAVYHYDGSGSITGTSNARVEVNYGGHDSIPVMNAPTSGDGTWWKVFEIVNGEVVPCISSNETCILNSQDNTLRSFNPKWLKDVSADGMPTK